MQQGKGIECERLHLVGNDLRLRFDVLAGLDRGRATRPSPVLRAGHPARHPFRNAFGTIRFTGKARLIVPGIHPERRAFHTYRGFRLGFLPEGLVARNPLFRNGNRVGIVPDLVVFRSHLMQHVATREGLEQHVPFLIAGECMMGQI